jgi:hypothetical protein
MGTTAIWYKDPVSAFGPKELICFPHTQDDQQQLNSVMRLSIYWSLFTTIKRDEVHVTADPDGSSRSQ